MNLRCRPGDLAFLVRSSAGNEGKLYTVIEWVGFFEFVGGLIGHDVWLVRCEQDTYGIAGGLYPKGSKVRIQDHCLRPSRNPGDDAVDETLLWLPAPSRDEVAA